jgi:hypothetical protein
MFTVYKIIQKPMLFTLKKLFKFQLLFYNVKNNVSSIVSYYETEASIWKNQDCETVMISSMTKNFKI